MDVKEKHFTHITLTKEHAFPNHHSNHVYRDKCVEECTHVHTDAHILQNVPVGCVCLLLVSNWVVLV